MQSKVNYRHSKTSSLQSLIFGVFLVLASINSTGGSRTAPTAGHVLESPDGNVIVEFDLKDIGDQEKGQFREITIERGEILSELVSSYEQWLEGVQKTTVSCRDNMYSHALEGTYGIGHDSQDVKFFSMVLKAHEEKTNFPLTGLFLSALFNTCPDKEFEILTEHLETPINYIGYKNTKQLNILGDAGTSVGHSMKGGSITVNGNVNGRAGNYMGGGKLIVMGDAGALVGAALAKGTIYIHGDAGPQVGMFMEGGSISINGTAGEETGESMRGGTITIGRDAGNTIGCLMSGGVIRIDGDIGSISYYWRSGEIYHRGKRVRPE